MLDVGDLDIANRCTVSVASNDVDPTTGRARLSHGCAAELFEAHTEHNDNGPVHPAPAAPPRLTHAAEDGASTPVLMKL
ncbi:hypothetical protein IU470_03835 [Nocardia abscessus]|uniref:Uncharacterized protein n=1 Tax=Nocardia abscessus TaxID=120957 RepID=A0ABS0C1J9_9NOCA|nr:hypothetical protein [Nocardia abscessus]MBF6224250.1 hypothetical protein [Nocardia abscessus]